MRRSPGSSKAGRATSIPAGHWGSASRRRAPSTRSSAFISRTTSAAASETMRWVLRDRLRRLLISSVVAALLVISVALRGVRAEEPGWRQVITPTDQDRLGRLAEAIREGDSRAAASDPAPEDLALLSSILDPADQPIAAGSLVGDWRCRTIKVGDILVAYAPFKCRIKRVGESIFL